MVLAFVVGCGQNGGQTAEEPTVPETAKVKPAGVSADQVGVTDAGRNADANVGSRAGGGE